MLNSARCFSWFQQAIYLGLLVLVVLSPLPLGSNREWSWSLCAAFISLLGMVWVLATLGFRGSIEKLPSKWTVGLFILVVVWVMLQMTPWVPVDWKHPLWQLAGDSLGVMIPGSISLATEDGWIALLRLLAYALVFFLAFQLGKDRHRARQAFFLFALSGLAYAVFGLYVYWSGNSPEWLFGNKQLAHDVRSTFVNRNHFVTWQGLSLLCGLAWFYNHMSQPVVMPYFVPKNRDDRVEEFILRAWKPLVSILLMVTALILTHSRGGFLSTLMGVIVLLFLLDRRGLQRKAMSRATVLTAVVVTSLAFYLTSEVVLDRLEHTDVSSEERLVIFADVNRGIAANPGLGFGYGTFADSFRLYDRIESPYHYDRAHNTWLENAFELGLPAALVLYLSLFGLVLVCIRGVFRRHRDWVYPATGVAASVLVGAHATVDFSLQIPAVAFLYAAILGFACAQSFSSIERQE